jgi:hypothetical protein
VEDAAEAAAALDDSFMAEGLSPDGDGTPVSDWNLLKRVEDELGSSSFDTVITVDGDAAQVMSIAGNYKVILPRS